jgi:hypothetical protein
MTPESTEKWQKIMRCVINVVLRLTILTCKSRLL